MNELKRSKGSAVVIEAWQIRDVPRHPAPSPDGYRQRRCAVPFGTLTDRPIILIDTLEGAHRADIRDFVIRGVAGEFYPCKPDIFEATYERERGHADE